MSRTGLAVAVTAFIATCLLAGPAHAAPTWLSKGQLASVLLTAEQVNAAVPQSVPVKESKDTYTTRRQRGQTGFPFHWFKSTVAHGYVREFVPIDGSVPLTTVPTAVEVYETASVRDARRWLDPSSVVANPGPGLTNEVKSGTYYAIYEAQNRFFVNVLSRKGRFLVGATCNGADRAATVDCATTVMNAQKAKVVG